MEKIGSFFDRIVEDYNLNECINDVDNFINECFKGIVLTDKVIVDLGCGTGIYSRFFIQKAEKVICIDASRKSLEKAIDFYHIYDAGLINAEPPPIPLMNESVDILFSKGTFAYISDVEGLLQETLRIIKYDGIIIIEFLNKNLLTSAADNVRRVFSRMSTEKSVKLAKIISIVCYPFLKFILGKKVTLQDGKKLEHIILEVLFSKVFLHPVRKKSISKFCKENSLKVNFLTIKDSKVYSSRTSFVACMRKSDAGIKY